MKGVLKKQLEDGHAPRIIIQPSSQPSTSLISINEKSEEAHEAKLTLVLSKKNLSQTVFQEKFQCQSVALNDDYTKATKCLATIGDPLWKYVCQNVMTMMGPASFLEIWECILGEVFYQNKSIDIYSPTEKSAQFIKQYSFVILGILKTYFPALKQINVKTIFP